MPEGGPPDPSRSSADEIRAVVSEPSGSAATAAGLTESAEETSPKEHLVTAAAALTKALGVEQARSAEAEGELAVGEITGAIERGLDPSEVLAAGISSGAITAEQADELAWNAARDAQGIFSDEELDEIDDDGWAVTEEIDEQQQALLGAAAGLAEYETAQRQSQRASEAAFAQSVANHEKSVAAMRALQSELQMNGDEMRGHLAVVDAELEAGILGPQVDLDALAASDPKLFASTLRAVSATVLETYNAAESADIGQRILDQDRDIASGLVINGQPVKEPPQLGVDEEKFVDRVVRRSQGPTQYERPPALAADKVPEYTVGGRKVSIDDVPSLDGTTARSRYRESQKRGDRAS